MKVKKTGKTTDTLEREQYLIQIGSDFDTKNAGKVIASHSELASIKEYKISEYKIEKSKEKSASYESKKNR